MTYAVDVEFAVSTDIEKAAGSVVGARDKRMTVGEELDGVDIGLVAGKSLDCLPCSDIPQLGEGITSTRDKGVLVGRVQTDAHDIAEVVGELNHFGTGLNIPLHASHISGGGQDAAVIDKAAAGQITGVTRQLTSDPGWAISVLVQVVD